MSDVLFDRESGQGGDIAFITLNRPKALNALTLDMINSIQAYLNTCDDDEKIKAVVVKSASEKAFCAGGDVVSLYHAGREGARKPLSFFEPEYRLNEYIHAFKKPYICLLDGITMGGGVGVSMHGNMPIATENFSFAMPETGIGFFPDVGGSHVLNRCHGKLGHYLGLTGSRIGVHEAVFAGLIKDTLRSEHIDTFISELLQVDLSDAPFDVIRTLLKPLALEEAENSLSEHESVINRAFAHQSVSEIMTALNSDGSEFSLKTLKILGKKSPTSLCVTLEQLIKSEGLTMPECMTMESVMVKRFMQQPDFFEGVRALLIDKDKNPLWEYASVSDVPAETVASYF